MSTTLQTRVPAGTWTLDPVHSAVGFEVDYLAGTFRGQFRDAHAELGIDESEAHITGTAKVASVDVKDENLAAHLQSPEFFDAERYPELSFESSEVEIAGEDVTVRGGITIKGVEKPAELEGSVTEPVADPYGRERIGFRLSGAIDRTAFGVSWNAPLPSGEPALADEVRLVAELYFVKEA
jgi:polyisoprenoid-binding protein YceI